MPKFFCERAKGCNQERMKKLAKQYGIDVTGKNLEIGQTYTANCENKTVFQAFAVNEFVANIFFNEFAV